MMADVPWWIPLSSAVIGGSLVIVGNIALEIIKRRLERKSLALAFRGELLAVIRIVTTRKYVEILDGAASSLALGHVVHISPIRIERNYFPIYTKNASKIGALPPAIAERLASTYTYANSFLEDATASRASAVTPAGAEFVEQTLEVLKRSINEAQAAVDLIEEEFLNTKESWWRSRINKLQQGLRN